MDVNKPCCIKKYVDMAKAMELDTEGKSDEEIADLFVKELYSLNADLEIKCDLKEKGITADIVDELVEAASKVTRLLGNNPKDLTRDEMKEIYLKLIAANK